MKVKLLALVAGFALAVGLPLAAMAGPAPGGPNTGDNDGVENAFDNCTLKTNNPQKDIDHDGCGDECDGDYDQDGTVGGLDFGQFKKAFGKSTGQAAYNASTDMDCDGLIGGLDFGLFKQQFKLAVPGPSGISNEGRDDIACP